MNWSDFADFADKNIDAIAALALVLAAFVGIWSTRSSHKSRISELRAEWIELNRADLAVVIGGLRTGWQGRHPYEYHEAIARVRMRLVITNEKTEVDHRSLDDTLMRIERGDARSLETSITNLGREIFRTEWKRAAGNER